MTSLTGLAVGEVRAIDVSCDACGRSLSSGTDNVGAIVGIAIAVTTDADAPFREAWTRIYPDLPLPFHVSICYVCWLKSLGAFKEDKC